tara:strand:- start:12802 stop:14394 length:1593 start_codon:yes stop_codon:yes gene_type:complete
MRSPRSDNQLIFDGFETDFEKWLDDDNRWVRLSRLIDWGVLSEAYNRPLSGGMGRPAKDARLVIGAVIIKHKLCLSDEETIEQIRENPYLQYFVGFKAFHRNQAFAPSLFVDIRRRMGPEVFRCFEHSIIAQLSKRQASPVVDCDDLPPSPPATGSGGGTDEGADGNDRPPSPPPAGKLILDATVAEQAIRYPTDLGLLNEAREISELIIDKLHPLLDPVAGLKKKVRTYRRKARQDYLSLVKQRRPGARKSRQAIRRQLQYLKRNLGHIESLLDMLGGRTIPLSHTLLRQYWIIQHVYLQQKQMFDSGIRRCDNRIVSIHQPHVRPIIRGKLNKSVEFGAKLGVSLTGDGVACVDHVSWEAYNEGQDMAQQVEAYKDRHGYYPATVLADPLYGSRDNRKLLKSKRIRFAGKPLGRPPKMTDAVKAQDRKQRRQDYRERIPIEGKFGQGKNGYGLNYIRAKTARTSEAWIKSIFMVMNLMVLIRLLCANLRKPQNRYNIAILITRLRNMIQTILSQTLITRYYALSGYTF